MIVDMPYFITNEDWWYYDWDDMKFKLTKEAPPLAVISYNEFYGIKDDEE